MCIITENSVHSSLCVGFFSFRFVRSTTLVFFSHVGIGWYVFFVLFVRIAFVIHICLIASHSMHLFIILVLLKINFFYFTLFAPYTAHTFASSHHGNQFFCFSLKQKLYLLVLFSFHLCRVLPKAECISSGFFFATNYLHVQFTCNFHIIFWDSSISLIWRSSAPC